MSHHRVAAGYLRTGNIDLAVLEIEGMREAWGKVSTLPRPAAFRDQERYTATMLDIAARLIGIMLVLNLGRTDVARESLDAIRASLSELRRAATASRCWPTACSTPTSRWMRCSPTTASPTGTASRPARSPIARRCSAATAWRRPASAIMRNSAA